MKNLTFIVTFLFSVTGCTSAITSKDVLLHGGGTATYVYGKVAGDGQEGIFRDVFVDSRPVLSSFYGGQSLPGQILHGAVQAGMLAGGAVGAAALLRPDKYNSNESNVVNADDNSNSSLQQGQGQTQGQKSTARATSAAASATNTTISTITHGVIQEKKPSKGPKGNNGRGNGGHDGSPNGHNDDDR